MSEFRLDKTFSKTSTLAEASNNYAYWQTKTIRERLEAANYLIKVAYRITEFPPMDKTICSTRKLTK
jgi:hypothetical protein